MPIKIHVYTIAKNEAQFVERWVQACASADGLHVLDTGSTDGTADKLKAMGVNVKVQEFKPWRFDTPRNVNLAMIPDDADVCVQIDMDEVLAPDWRKEIEAVWKPGTTHMKYFYAWSMHDGKPCHVILYDKIHSRHGYEWRKPVHEIICPKKGVTEVFADSTKILHYHFPDGSKPRSQYLPLLKLACEEEPEDQRNWLYYGRELMFANQYKESIECLNRYLSMPGSTWPFERSFACIILAKCYGGLNDLAAKEAHLIKACGEEMNQREAWVELADHYRVAGKHLYGYSAACRALSIENSWRFFCSEPSAYGEKPHDIAAVTGYYAGHQKEAVRHAWDALCINPHDDRLAANYEVTRDLAPKDPPNVYSVDVIILAWSKHEAAYKMCCRAVRNLRATGNLNSIIVVETNKNIRTEPFVDGTLFGDGVITITPDEKFGYNRYLNIAYDLMRIREQNGATPGKYIMIMNNDVVLFSEGFMRKMIEACQQFSSVCPDGLREALWGRNDSKVLYHPGYGLNAVNGWCIMFDRAILNAVPFSELFPSEIEFHYQDCYYAEMLKSRGLRHALTTGAKALHLQAQSISMTDDQARRRMTTTGQQFIYDRLIAKNILKVPFVEPQVYDCFTFFNELETLQLRLETLDGVVDRFVLVEASKTFSGHDKPLCFRENMARFEKYLHKIAYVVIDDMPQDTPDRWQREYFQRNAIMRGLSAIIDNDFILISDVDEIPHPDRILERRIGSYKQTMYNYYYNVLNTCEDWVGTVATTGEVLRKGVKPQDLRDARHHSTKVQDGGWHFSWIGDAELLRVKLHAFSHTEYDTPEMSARLPERIDKLVDFAGRYDEKQFMVVPIDSSFPLPLQDHLEKYTSSVKSIEG